MKAVFAFRLTGAMVSLKLIYLHFYLQNILISLKFICCVFLYCYCKMKESFFFKSVKYNTSAFKNAVHVTMGLVTNFVSTAGLIDYLCDCINLKKIRKK